MKICPHCYALNGDWKECVACHKPLWDWTDVMKEILNIKDKERETRRDNEQRTTGSH